MKRTLQILLLAVTFIALQGCIAIPPLIHVQHKESSSNDAVLRKLDSIEQRLDRLEGKSQNK